jgi:hypothetical protein
VTLKKLKNDYIPQPITYNIMGGVFKYWSVEGYTGQLVQEPREMYCSTMACGRTRDISP